MEDFSLDLAAASLRAGGADRERFVETLARKLEEALPARVRVERRAKRLLSRDRRVERIEVALGDLSYVLDARAGEARRAKVVRGVTIKTEQLELAAWLEALTAGLRAAADESEDARQALEKLLL